MTTLHRLINEYLCDAGFKEDLYTLIELENREYIEVFFESNNAIDYILNDIEHSDFNNLLDIIKYEHEHNVISIIITYKNN